MLGVSRWTGRTWGMVMVRMGVREGEKGCVRWRYNAGLDGAEFAKMYRAQLGPVDGEGCGEDGVRRRKKGVQ